MSLFERIKRILRVPQKQWLMIEQEVMRPKDLLLRYVAPLAAIPAAAQFLEISLFGVHAHVPGGHLLSFPIGLRLAQMLASFVILLASVWVLAWVINLMAPLFRAQKNIAQALKLTAYSITPFCLASVLGVLPALAAVALLLSLYSFYLLYLGLPVLMKAPADQVLPYTIAAVIAAIVIYFVSAVLVGAFMPRIGPA